MKTRHKSQDPLRKLSSSRISSKKVPKLSSYLPPKQTSSLFGIKKNVIVTYSKSRPILVVKKNHFHTPDTPQVLTPDELQTAEGKEGKDTMSKNTNPASQGGSYVSGKMLLSSEASSLQMTNKIATPFESTKHPSCSSIRSIRQGSSLALRNISNIPIEKTMSMTQCTPDRSDAQRTYQDKDSKSLRKPTKKPPISWKRRKELIKQTKEYKQLNENEEQENRHQEKGKQKKMSKSLSTNDKTCSVHSNRTNYSAKSMSTCTTASSRGASKQGHTGTLSAQSMSLCSTMTNDPNVGPKPVALRSVDEEVLLPKNSTFNDSAEHVMIQEFFSNQLSPIKDESIKKPSSLSVEQEKLQKKVTSTSSDKLENHLNQNPEAQRTSSCESYHQDTSINSSNTGNNGPKTSTPTDQGKLPAIFEVDVSPILEASDGKKESIKHVPQETGVKRNSGTESKRNSSSRCGKDKSVSLDHKAKPKTHSSTKDMQNQVESLKENSKTFLPLQASICIEDDSDPEQIQDNITPEMMEPIKTCPSSSKRKLYYGSSLYQHDENVCILLDLKCTRKKPCKLWMRTKNHSIDDSKQDAMCVPQDILTLI